MPLPTPNINESDEDFIDRCMVDETMVEDFEDNKQRLAVCNTQLEDKEQYEEAKKLEKMKKTEKKHIISLEEDETTVTIVYEKDIHEEEEIVEEEETEEEEDMEDDVEDDVEDIEEEDEQNKFRAWDKKFNNTVMEKRIFNIETRAEETEDGNKVIVGHASMYGTRSENLGGFYEYIEKGAFTPELIEGSDVRALINHDQNLILARTTSGTLRLNADAKGLRYEFDVPQTSYGKDLLVSMDRGDINQSSFAFTVQDDEWETDDDGNNIRTIKKIDRLYDVSPVTYPAYPNVDDLVVAQRGLATYKEKVERENEEKDLVKRSLVSLKIELKKRK